MTTFWERDEPWALGQSGEVRLLFGAGQEEYWGHKMAQATLEKAGGKGSLWDTSLGAWG